MASLLWKCLLGNAKWPANTVATLFKGFCRATFGEHS